MAQQEDDDAYKIKRIPFGSRQEVPIFMQNLNGPCPLIAVANILSLRNQLRLPEDTFKIEPRKLISLVAEQMLQLNAKAAEDTSAYGVNTRQNMTDVLDHLPKLSRGVDVNVKFNSISGFEPTNDVLVFDLLDISLVHGWVVDPHDAEVASVLGNRYYNELVEAMISEPTASAAAAGAASSSSPPSLLPPAAAGTPPAHQQQQQQPDLISFEEDGDAAAAAAPTAAPQAPEQLVHELVAAMFQRLVLQGGAPPSPSQPPAAAASQSPQQPSVASPDASSVALARRIHDAEIIRAFFDAHCSQLTVFGVSSLLDGLRDNQLAVFFRNNHFSTLFKTQGALYLLVTDQGYLSEPGVAWERLDTVDGDTQICGPDFAPFKQRAGGGGGGAQDAAARAAADDRSAAADAAALAAAYDHGTLAQSDADLALALQLQEEEEFEARRARERAAAEARAAEEQQRQQQQQQQQQQQRHPQQQGRPAVHGQQQAAAVGGGRTRPTSAGGGHRPRPQQQEESKCAIM